MSQLADSIINGPMFFSAIPAEKAAALIYVPGLGWMEWTEVTGAGAFVGYRTLRCGALEFGTTAAPRGYEADLVGGLGSKITQASIWAWAQQQGQSVAAAAWTPKVFKFADVDASSFRFPDMRDVFVGMTGTNPDTGLARAIGSYLADAMQGHIHQRRPDGKYIYDLGAEGGNVGYATAGSTNLGVSTGTGGPASDGVNGVPRVAARTRPESIAFAPRIHI